MLEEASQLFYENYEVWSERVAQVLGKFAKTSKSIHSNIGLY